MGSLMGHVSLRVAQWNRKRVSHSVLLKQALAQSYVSILVTSKLSYRYTGNASHG